MTRAELQKIISELKTEVSATEKRRSSQYSSYQKAQTASKKHETNYYARLRRQEQLEDFPENPTEALWCLDYTTDIEIGAEVGTLDMAGYAKYNGRNIQPGYKKNYEYDMARDGKLHHAFPGFNLMFSYLKFLTFNEGFQKWYPSSRYAVIVAWETQVGEEITELDYWEVKPTDKLAYIRYLPAYSAWLKNSIDPYPEDKHNVPISYMACNHQAFKINDVVLVKFVDQDIEIEKFKIRNKETSQTQIELEHQKEKLKAKQELYDLKFGNYTKEQLEKLDTKQKNEAFNLTSDIVIAESKISALEIRMEEIRDKSITFPDGWAKPLIIGFKDHPRPCPFFLYFIRDPILYYDEKGDEVASDSDARKTSARVFDVDEYIDNGLDEREPDKAVSIALPLNSRCKAGYNNVDSEHGARSCNSHCSKTLYRTTVHALSWTILGTSILQWGVFIEHNGEAYVFKPSEVDREQDTTLWPPLSFENTFLCSPYTRDGSYTPNKSFDVFELEEIWDDYSWDIGDIVVIMHGRKESCEIWNITQDDYKFKSIPIYEEIMDDFSEEMNVEHRTISLGISKNIIYIAYGALSKGEMVSFSEIYGYNVFTNAFTALGESGDFCCFNPFREEVVYFDFGDEDETSDIFMENPHFVEVLGDPVCDTGPVCDNWNHDGKYIGFSRMPPFSPDTCERDEHGVCVGPSCATYSGKWSAILSKSTKHSKLGGQSEMMTGGMCPNYEYWFFIWHWHDPALCGDQTLVISDHYYENNVCPVSSGGALIRQWGNYYKDWLVSNVSIHASITDKNTGCRITGTVKNGVIASNATSSTNTIVESEKNFDFGGVQDEFISTKWPYVNNYAIAKDVTDSEGENYKSLIAIQDKDSHIVFDDNDLGEYDMTGLFQFYIANLEVFRESD